MMKNVIGDRCHTYIVHIYDVDHGNNVYVEHAHRAVVHAEKNKTNDIFR